MKLKKVRVVAFVALLAAFCACAEQQSGETVGGDGRMTVFVSPNGNDRASGSREAPLATLSGALSRLRAAGGVVKLMGGVYELDETVRMGKAQSHLRIEADDEAQPPVFSGGRRLQGWTVDAHGWWRLKVDPSWRFSQLYVNGQRRLRPYRPRKGYFPVDGKVSVPPGVKPTRFYAREGDISETWADFNRMELCLFHNWVMSRVPVKSYDPATRLVTLGGGVARPGNSELSEEFWYRLDNVRDALGELPGEWYREGDGTLVYVPMPGESPSETTVVAPRLERLFELDGASFVTFRGVTFAHTSWNMPTNGHAACQAESRLGGWAVAVAHGADVRFERCVFRQLGSGGLEFGRGSRGGVVRDCELVDLGTGGIHVGPGLKSDKWGDSSLDFAATPARDYVCDTLVTNCLIVGGGRVQAGGEGVWVSHAPRTRLIGNTIMDFYYSGISVGWNWALGPNSTWGNEIADNHIAYIGQGVLSDLGGIYMLGAQTGTVIRGNWIHDVTRSRYGAWGIYFDSGSSFIAVSNNYVRHCQDGGWFLARLTASNRVENNVFADGACNGGRYQICPLERRVESSPTLFAGNIVSWQNGSLWPQTHSEKTIALSNNVLWRAAQRMKMLPRGFRELDPQLNELPEVEISSPAVGAGFSPFSAKGAGCHLKRQTRQLPRPLIVYPPMPAPIERPFAKSDFETLPVRSAWPGWTYYPQSATNLVYVSKARAATGKQSLCITDDGKVGYHPFVETQPRRAKGLLNISFDLFIEKGACPHFETRDGSAVGLTRGPTLYLDARGNIHSANGSVVAKAVYDAWMHVELSCKLGDYGNPQTYTLRLTFPGENVPRTFDGLWMHPEFAVLDWMGWLSLSQGGERYYVDDFQLLPEAVPHHRFPSSSLQ